MSCLSSFPLIKRALLVGIVACLSGNAIAADLVSDNQIKRVAKIAKASKTRITMTKEKVTVTVDGGTRHSGKKKKSAKKRSKTVTDLLNRREKMDEDALDSRCDAAEHTHRAIKPKKVKPKVSKIPKLPRLGGASSPEPDAYYDDEPIIPEQRINPLPPRPRPPVLNPGGVGAPPVLDDDSSSPTIFF